jgi:hypothetical protein
MLAVCASAAGESVWFVGLTGFILKRWNWMQRVCEEVGKDVGNVMNDRPDLIDPVPRELGSLRDESAVTQCEKHRPEGG